MSRPWVSLVNRAVGATLTASTEDATYVKANAATPEAPMRPWKTTGTADSWLVLDLGAAYLIETVALIRTNWTSGKIQAHTADSWATPDYDSGTLTITRHPFTGRYQHVHQPATPPTKRYVRVWIPTQTPVAEKDGQSAASVFLLGGVWIGAQTALPSGLRIEPPVGLETIEPHEDIGPEHKGWSQRLVWGEPRWRLVATRRPGTTVATPGFGDTLASWMTLDRQMRNYGRVLFAMNVGDPAQCGIMQRTSPPAWQLGVGSAESAWELDESVR